MTLDGTTCKVAVWTEYTTQGEEWGKEKSAIRNGGGGLMRGRRSRPSGERVW